MSEKRKAVN